MDARRNDLWDEARELLQHVEEAESEIRRVIVGMEAAVHILFVGLLARGHCIAESPPGLAKTKLMKAMSHVSGLTYGRVEGNPGLMRDDIIGQYLPSVEGSKWRGGLEFFHGPVFNEMVLWDEANRTSPKTQSGMLQAMEEYHVTTCYGEIKELPKPFMVLATQNPREITQGTYPLTDANLDRFLMSVTLDYPKEDEEVAIIAQDDSEPFVEDLRPVLNGAMILRMRDLIKELYPSGKFSRAEQYAVRLGRATRPESNGAGVLRSLNNEKSVHRLEDIVHSGISTRAIKLLARASRAHAFLRQSQDCTVLDVRSIASFVLRHRMVLRSGRLGFTPDHVIAELIRAVPEVAEENYDAQE
ncbi:MAG: MoxR family ATPase [Candidatus Sungbacteria bacterium]|nr:MoxR family ATPase [bacterium]MDZ4260237.1 MoxR family ATPase [Candidatus Sungbacteria bacterium]